MKKLVTSYTFDASAKTIDSADFTSLEKIQLITNVTDQIIIYNFADTVKGGSLTSTTLTLEYDTSSMDDTDKLQIFVEDGSATQTVSGTVTANAGTNLNTSALALESGGNLAAIKSKADNIPSLGQALAAASVPVVLPAAQITTLTPPAAITGFATEAKQLADNHQVTVSNIASVPLITGFATSTKQSDGSQKTQIVDAGGEAATVTGGKLDVNASIDTTGLALAANQLPDGHNVTIANASIPVTGTFWQATQPVSGTVAVTSAGITTIAGAVSGTEMQVDVLTMPTTTVTATDLDIRNLTNTDVVTAELSAVDNAVLDTIAAKDFATQTTLAAINTKLVSGTDIGDVTINNASGVAAVNIQDGGNTITVDGTVTANTGLTQPLTDTQLRATAVPVSGTVTANATLAAETTKVIGTVNIASSQTVGLAAGSNAIGKLASNSGVDIGDVTLTAGTAAIGFVLPPDTDVTAHTNYARKYYTNAGAVTDGIIWSPAAGKRWHVVTLYIQVSADATVTLEDDKAAGDDPVWKGEIAAKSGVVLQFTEHYPMASGEDAADLMVTTSAGNVYITCVGYEI